MTVTCPDLTGSCSDLSLCCDRNYGNFLIGSRCANTYSCDLYYSDYGACTCEKYVKPGILAGIVIACIIVFVTCVALLIIRRNKRRQEMGQSQQMMGQTPPMYAQQPQPQPPPQPPQQMYAQPPPQQMYAQPPPQQMYAQQPPQQIPQNTMYK
ncbi:7590_t:CDS:1 [Acaulospora morrowiae]|uniref:7590_t:CDS:1 n=1 Tax=Acaulospora morrowiae TaxID=94023 RepID=A0A9N9ED12_9GLOM|nr:7590_t:CDS:1 [Acaulospora morrowiae]